MEVSMIRRMGKSFCEVTGIPDYWIKSTMFEAKMALIRIYSSLPSYRFKVDRTCSRTRPLNLIFGCGSTSYDGWLGVDCTFSSHVEFPFDLRRNLPFKSENVDLCYSEHFIEHLTQKEAIRHMSEICRILKPGGRYRIVVPHSFRFIERYLANDMAFFELAFPWANRPIDAVRDIVYFSGAHKNLYDLEELTHIGKQVGFNKIVESSANSSDVPELRIDRNEDQRVAESLYVEMIK